MKLKNIVRKHCGNVRHGGSICKDIVQLEAKASTFCALHCTYTGTGIYLHVSYDTLTTDSYISLLQETVVHLI